MGCGISRHVKSLNKDNTAAIQKSPNLAKTDVSLKQSHELNFIVEGATYKIKILQEMSSVPQQVN